MTDSLRRERVWQTPPGVRLCPVDSIEEPGARNFVLQIGEALFHGFVVRENGAVHGYVDQCPHAGLPLARELDGYLTAKKELIACSWHGALFRLSDGVCVGGPCAGSRLTPWPVHVEDGWLKTA
ncbi:Rieske (2Fe-2S) protein [Vulgatibacter incomptus]|uniref:Ferredoxin, 2Fe-2S n=1 Tax=Vulgatibacter incomptus TaxID=1391653 RepID=A0A0K1PHS5_9BACT|nr:Rieske (2Fe-2S) protein [Vulgatibacter incomptus]AKU93062.1 Ferredoxin, 2Fe-2S [Vulgatibacter incomptus]